MNLSSSPLRPKYHQNSYILLYFSVIKISQLLIKGHCSSVGTFLITFNICNGYYYFECIVLTQDSIWLSLDCCYYKLHWKFDYNGSKRTLDTF
ncbi:hypothetical protein C0J52_24090 [Blattella germanica]|nr:hypothetical protein C0J52_24090 [Blattella germanica]